MAPISLVLVPVATAFVTFLFYRYVTSTRINLPIINQYPGDITHNKAFAAYKTSSTQLVKEGIRQFNGPFRILTPLGDKVVLPSDHHDWVKASKDVSHQALIMNEFFGAVPGFDSQRIIGDPSGMMIRLTKEKISQNPESIGTMSEALEHVLRTTWTDSKEWHTLNWIPHTMKLISRMSASIFVGPELGADPEWQAVTIGYVSNFFAAVTALQHWPRIFSNVVHWILPEVNACRRDLREMRRLLSERPNKLRGDSKATNMLEWVEEDTRKSGVPSDPAAVQSAFAMAALHTTSEALRQILLDLCQHPDIISPMRKEMKDILATDGLSIASLYKMQLLDSVMKESQRLGSAIVGLERQVTRDTVLPNGVKLPKGTILGVDASDMLDATVHDDPQVFDPYRFLKLREAGGAKATQAQFVSSTKEHNTFGAGKFICPGRFFAANELKIALIHILLRYDVRLKDSSRVPTGGRMGYFWMTDWTAMVEVRRRDVNVEMEFPNTG